MRQGKSRAAHLKVVERRRFVFEMRKSGASYEQIHTAARTVLGADLPPGYSKRQVWKDVMLTLTALAEQLSEDAAVVRQLELARLDEMQLALTPETRRGNVQVIDRQLKIMEHRARLLGLYGPVKVAPTTPDGEAPYPVNHVVEEPITADYIAEVAQHLADYGLFHRQYTNGHTVSADAALEGDTL